ncbi:MAG: urea transporter [Marinobacterium sp.]|nr:urea transporter [Marinobacterium sp.]
MNGFLTALLRGMGQLLFMPHAGTGLLALLGILLNSPLMAMAVLTGTLGATLVGSQVMERQAFNQGLAGFNGALLGLAAALFMQPSALLWLSVFLGGGLAGWCFNWGMRRNLQLLTAPYICLMLLIWALLPRLPQPDGGIQLHWLDAPVLSGALAGVGQMGFQGNLLSALCMAAGLIICRGWRALGWALLGSLTGAVAGALMGISPFSLATGLASYNCALIAVALAIVSGHRSRSWQLWLGMAVTAALTLVGLKLALIPVLTIPFVLAMWLVIGAERCHSLNAIVCKRRKNYSDNTS